MQPNRYYDKVCDDLAFILKLGSDIDWRVLRSTDLMMRSRDEFVAGQRIIVEARQSIYGVEIPVSFVLVERDLNAAVNVIEDHARYGFKQAQESLMQAPVIALPHAHPRARTPGS